MNVIKVPPGCRMKKEPRWKTWLRWQRSRIRKFIAWHTPRIAFFGQEIEARIWFDLDKIDFEKLRQVERLLFEMGVYFDTGTGCGKRDWFVDFSLRGPMHIYYKRPRKNVSG